MTTGEAGEAVIPFPELLLPVLHQRRWAHDQRFADARPVSDQAGFERSSLTQIVASKTGFAL
jgi:hypothetical protein